MVAPPTRVLVVLDYGCNEIDLWDAWESFLSLLRASVRRARAVEQKRAGRIMRPGSCAGDRRGTRTHLMDPVLCFETGRSERDARRWRCAAMQDGCAVASGAVHWTGVARLRRPRETPDPPGQDASVRSLTQPGWCWRGHGREPSPRPSTIGCNAWQGPGRV